MFNRRTLIVAALATVVCASPSFAQDKSIVVASTTSTQDSGLFEYLLPLFTKKTGITVKVVAQGTGQALDTGRRGDADVVFVHAKSAEEKFLAEGQGVKRFAVMYNDFVLIGPKSDPAGIKGMKDVGRALTTIKDKQASFISRGDKSGTDIAELALWKVSEIDIETGKGDWYKSTSARAMGASSSNTAQASNGGLCAVTTAAPRSRFKNTRRSRGPGRGRQAGMFDQSRRHAGQPGQASEREERARPGLHRLSGFAARTEGYSQLQNRRRAVVLSERQRCGGVMRV